MAIRSKSVKGNELVIAVDGSFDFSCLQEFRESYEKKQAIAKSYVVDLDKAEYIDSSALGMLLALRDYAGGEHADIKIINGSQDIRNIFLKSKLCEMFYIE
tara:strand:+ start:10346 stop:10648 length:303 start_codon:yes stop_codon:yes gene_type:complete